MLKKEIIDIKEIIKLMKEMNKIELEAIKQIMKIIKNKKVAD